MLGRLILILLQIAAGWFAGPFLFSHVPVPGGLGLFVYAIIFAVLAFLVGVLGGLVIKDVGQPSSSALTVSLVLALIAAAVVTYVPAAMQLLGNALSQRGVVLAAAIIGYLVKR